MKTQRQILNTLKTLPPERRSVKYCNSPGCPFSARKSGLCEIHEKKIVVVKE